MIHGQFFVQHALVALYAYERDVTEHYYPNPNPNHEKGAKCGHIKLNKKWAMNHPPPVKNRG